MKRLILIISLPLLFAACNDSSNNGGGTLPPGAEAYYPLQAGNWWQFTGVELDSLDNEIPGTEYTRSSTVIGDTVTANHAYSIVQDSTDVSGSWVAEERQYVRIEGDTVKFLMSFFDDPAATHEVNMAILPADVGDTWTVASLDTVITDSSSNAVDVALVWTGELLATGSVTVPVGTLDDAVHIGYVMTFDISVPDTSISFVMESKLWLAPDLGLVRHYQAATDGPDGYANGTWEELVNFVLVPIPAVP